jgi:hypothetical protein
MGLFQSVDVTRNPARNPASEETPTTLGDRSKTGIQMQRRVEQCEQNHLSILRAEKLRDLPCQ